jgi:hypothetical protein
LNDPKKIGQPFDLSASQFDPESVFVRSDGCNEFFPHSKSFSRNRLRRQKRATWSGRDRRFACLDNRSGSFDLGHQQIVTGCC